MPEIDFSTPLRRVSGKPMSARDAGLPAALFESPEEWQKGATLAELLEPVLLYTVDRDENGESRFLSPKEKMDRFHITLKIRDGGPVELRDQEIRTIIKAINILPPEGYGVVVQILKPPDE